MDIEGRDIMKRERGKGIRVLVAGVLVAGALAVFCSSVMGREVIASVVVRVMEERSARQTVRQFGMEVTRENVALYKLSFEGRRAWEPFPSRHGAAASGASIPFAEGLTYGDLHVEGRIPVGVCVQPASDWDWLMPLVQDAIDAAAGQGIDLRPLRTEAEFRDALLHDRIVFYVGHANHGRGMSFGPEGEEVLIPVPGADPVIPPSAFKETDEILEQYENGLVRIATPGEVLPVDRCRLFVYLGCRTGPNYEDALATLYPETGLVLCHYIWSVNDFIAEALKILLQGLENERPLAEIMERWEDQIRWQMFWARSRERGQFKDPGPYPDHMLSYHPPAAALAD